MARATNSTQAPKATRSPRASKAASIKYLPAQRAAAPLVGLQIVPATPVAPAPVAAPVAAPQGPTLQAFSTTLPNVRQGTAAAAALAALVASVGQPRPAVLAALVAAETGWHQSQGRSVKGVAPSGWLRKFGATFA